MKTNYRCVISVIVACGLFGDVGQGVSAVATQPIAAGKDHQPNTTDFQFAAGDLVLRIPVTWKNKEASFYVDTGATYNFVDAGAFGDLVEDRKMTGTSSTSSSVDYTLCKPPSVRVGPFALDQCGLVARIDLSHFPRQGRPAVVGGLGMAAMKNATLQIDFDKHLFRWLPPFTGARPEWGQTVIPLDIPHDDVPQVQLQVGTQTVAAALDTGCTAELSMDADDFDRLPGPTSVEKN